MSVMDPKHGVVVVTTCRAVAFTGAGSVLLQGQSQIGCGGSVDGRREDLGRRESHARLNHRATVNNTHYGSVS